MRGTNGVDLDSLGGWFVRKVRTASGATAVQIASKTRGVRTIVEHLGSAHDDEQLAVLVAIARERIAELAGHVPFDLDGLGATPPPRPRRR